MPTDRKTLAQFLKAERLPDDGTADDLRAIILDVSTACVAMSNRLATCAFDVHNGDTTGADGQGEAPDQFTLLSDGRAVDGTARAQVLESLANDIDRQQAAAPCGLRSGRFLVTVIPFDNTSAMAAHAPGGTIFSILKAPGLARDAVVADFQQPGDQLVCAGYTFYGAATALVLAIGREVGVFVLDRQAGQFVLTRAGARVPEIGRQVAIDTSNSRAWEPAIRRYFDECVAGESGPRGSNFQIHWTGSMVGEVHRILVTGGLFACPRHMRVPSLAKWPRLLQEANPISFIFERAGGRATTGITRVLDIEPSDILVRTPLILGASSEVDRLVSYYVDPETGRYDTPLFGERGLFRATV